MTTAPATSPAERVAATGNLSRGQRLLSLDAFRGATIVGMILVNNPGSWAAGNRYGPLDHAEWHGLTPTDWIFPFFLFIVGVAIPFSQAKRHEPFGTAFLHILRRSAILFGLGLLLASIPFSATSGIMSPSTLRIPGVLQRIAVCYAVVATLALFVNWRAMIAIGIGLMAVYSALMLLVPAPGFPAGDLSKEGNLAHFIDKTVLGSHGYKPYNDPEGLLSTLPAIGSVICGWLAGLWLRRPDEQAGRGEKVAALMSFGVFGLIVGYVLSAALMPLNKQIWTPSYTVYTAGLACLGLGASYWLIDIAGYRRWATPLVACGMNAITVFVLAGAVGRLMNMRLIRTGTEDTAGEPIYQAIKPWLYNRLFVPWFDDPRNASLAWALVFVGLFVLLSLWMHSRRIYLKV